MGTQQELTAVVQRWHKEAFCPGSTYADICDEEGTQYLRGTTRAIVEFPDGRYHLCLVPLESIYGRHPEYRNGFSRSIVDQSYAFTLGKLDVCGNIHQQSEVVIWVNDIEKQLLSYFMLFSCRGLNVTSILLEETTNREQILDAESRIIRIFDGIMRKFCRASDCIIPTVPKYKQAKLVLLLPRIAV